MRTLPPGDRPSQIASTSSFVLYLRWNDRDGLNLNEGPALIAMNGSPASSKDTRSQSPDGVPGSVVTLVSLDPGIKETYSSAACRASLSNHRCGVISCTVFYNNC